MQRAVSQWALERGRGNLSLAIEAVRAIILQAQGVMREYIRAAGAGEANAREAALDQMRLLLDGVADVFAANNEGLSEFLDLQFRRVFSSSYARWQDLLLQITASATSAGGARNEALVQSWRSESDALRDILRVPLNYFGNTWASLIPDITQRRATARIGTRESVLGKRAKKSVARKAVTKEAKEASIQRADNVERQRAKRAVDQKDADPFPVVEPYAESSVPDPSIYVTAQYQTDRVYKNGDDELWAMVPTIVSLGGQPLPSLAEFWMLKHEAGFWSEEYFNVSLASCDFSAPAVLESDSNFRRYIMFNLLKLAQAATTARDTRYQGALAVPLFTMTQWREYMSTQFPLSSIVYFQETPASGSAQGQRLKQQLDSDASRSPQFQYLMQALSFVQRYFVVAQAQVEPAVSDPEIDLEPEFADPEQDVEPEIEDDGESAVGATEENFPLTYELMQTLGSYCGDIDAFVPCCNNELRYSDFNRLLGATFGGELNDAVINHFMRPILANGDATGSFIFVSSLVPDLLRRPGRTVSRALYKTPTRTSRIVFPINYRLVHWYLLVADFARERFEVYDSISPHVQDDENVTLVASWLDAQTGANTKTWPVVPMLNETLQPDLVSCGVYTCMFAQVLVENEGRDILDLDVSFLRSFICEQLLEGAMIPITSFNFIPTP